MDHDCVGFLDWEQWYEWWVLNIGSNLLQEQLMRPILLHRMRLEFRDCDLGLVFMTDLGLIFIISLISPPLKWVGREMRPNLPWILLYQGPNKGLVRKFASRDGAGSWRNVWWPGPNLNRNGESWRNSQIMKETIHLGYLNHYGHIEWYSALADDKEIEVYFFDFQEMGEPPKMT